jgi:hypothetical protein
VLELRRNLLDAILLGSCTRTRRFLMSGPRTFNLGDALVKCHRVAVDDWCKQHAPGVAREVAAANSIPSVLMQTLFGSFGKVNVTVTVSGRRRGEDQVYFWRFVRATDHRVTLEGGTVDL